MKRERERERERRRGERAVVNLNLIARSFIREAAEVGAIMEAWIFMETRAPCNLYETTATRRRPADRRDASRFTLSVRALAKLNYPRARTRKMVGRDKRQKTWSSLFLFHLYKSEKVIDSSFKQLSRLHRWWYIYCVNAIFFSFVMIELIRRDKINFKRYRICTDNAWNKMNKNGRNWLIKFQSEFVFFYLLVSCYKYILIILNIFYLIFYTTFQSFFKNVF